MKLTPLMTEVRALVARVGVVDVANRIGVAEGTVRGWLRGEAKPTKRTRERIERAYPELVRTPATKPTAARVETQVALERVVDPIEEARQAVVAAASLADDLARDPGARARDRVGARSAHVAATRNYAKLKNMMLEEQILQTPSWKRIERTMIDALKAHPPALHALEAALEKLREEEIGKR